MLEIEKIIEYAIQEDVGNGDHSSLSCIPENVLGKAKLLVKQDGIIAGIDVAKMVFAKVDRTLRMEIWKKDGSRIKKGDIAFVVEGKVRSILLAERLALNILQRMSGIATHTNIYVEKIKGFKTKVLDTRKTSPNLRILEKMAVRIGGGENHRMGLYDMIMLKDNHIDFAGGINKAIEAANNYLKNSNKELKIEIEVRNLDELADVLKIGGVQRVMLDNFTPDLTREAVKLINGQFEIESSGGITLETIRDYAECGVDYISVGALTHQINSLDLSLKAF